MRRLRFTYFDFLISIYLILSFLSFENILRIVKYVIYIFLDVINKYLPISFLLDYNLMDKFSSVLFFFTGIVLIIWKRKKLKEIRAKNKIGITILLALFVYAPILTDFYPSHFQDLSFTKFKKPLSTVKYQRISVLYGSTLERRLEERTNFENTNNCEKIIFTEDGSNSKLFILGSDEYGRDIFARLVYGTRVTLFISLASVMIAVTVACLLAMFSDTRRKFLDLFLNRLTDLFLSVPLIFLILFVISFFGSSMFVLILLLGMTSWMSLFKVLRTEMILIKNRDYYITSQLIGINKTRIFLMEILPSISHLIIVNSVFLFTNIIFAQSALEFLGLGVGQNYPTWGSMLEINSIYQLEKWWLFVFPSVIIISSILIFNNIGKKMSSYYKSKLND